MRAKSQRLAQVGGVFLRSMEMGWQRTRNDGQLESKNGDLTGLIHKETAKWVFVHLIYHR